MGREEIDRKKITIVDFLYKDMNLINSFYSQMFQGSISSITKTEISATTSVNEGNLNLGVAGGKLSSDQSESQSIASNINPLDSIVLDLIEALNVHTFDGKLAEHNDNSLVSIKGNLIFRDYKIISDILPMITNSNLVPEFSQPVNPNAKSKTEKAFTLGKLMQNIINIIPHGLEFEIVTEDRENIIAIIEEEFLTIKPNDLIRAYGDVIPNQWTIIGIIDRTNKTEIKSKSQFKNGVDEVTKAFYQAMGNNENGFIIRPVVIYRKIKY
jgi:hypothetical protein